MIPEDGELVRRMTRGDSAALGLLYERHSADVMRVAHALLRNDAHAADLVQDVFLEVWRRAEQYDEERGSVRAWLLVRTRSRALDRLRAKNTKREVTLLESSFDGALTSEPEMSGLQLPRAFEQVSEEERAVLVLGYFEGLTCVEMSEQLDIPVGTVKSRTRSAIGKLRAFFESDTAASGKEGTR